MTLDDGTTVTDGTTATCEVNEGECRGALCSTLDCPTGYTRREDTELRCAGLSCSLERHTDTCCIRDVDCQITWNADSCVQTVRADITPSGYNIISDPIGSGLSCDVVASTESPCNPGEGSCPQNIDCLGDWTLCNSDCQKTYTVTTEKSGTGAECPYEMDYLHLANQVKDLILQIRSSPQQTEPSPQQPEDEPEQPEDEPEQPEDEPEQPEDEDNTMLFIIGLVIAGFAVVGLLLFIKSRSKKGGYNRWTRGYNRWTIRCNRRTRKYGKRWTRSAQ